MPQRALTINRPLQNLKFKGLLGLFFLICILSGSITWISGLKQVAHFLLFGGLFVLFCVIFTRPDHILQLLLLFLLVSYIFSGFIEGAFGFMIKESLFILLIVSWLIRSLLSKNLCIKNVRPANIQIIMIVWVALLIVEAIRQPIIVGFFGFRSIALYSPLAFIMPSVIDNKIKFKRTLNTLAVAAVGISVIAITQYFFLEDIMVLMGIKYGDVGYRTTVGHLKASSTLGDPGAAGVLIGVFLLVYLSYWYNDTVKDRVSRNPLKIIALAVMFFGFILTLSRSAWIACFVGFIFWLSVNKKIAKKVVFWVTIFVIGLNFSINNFVIDNFLSIFGVGINVRGIESRNSRIEIVANTFDDYFSNRPLFGYGLGITGAPSMRNSNLLRDGYVLMDNYYLKLIVETGMLGTLLFLGIILSNVIVGIRQFRNLQDRELANISLGIGLGLGVIFISSFTLSVLENPVLNMYFWSFLGLLSACSALDHCNDIGLRHPKLISFTS